jgi:hypothetical protein
VAIRFRLTAQLDDRRFEIVPLDVGIGFASHRFWDLPACQMFGIQRCRSPGTRLRSCTRTREPTVTSVRVVASKTSSILC